MDKPLILFKLEWFQHPEWWFQMNPSVDAYLVETYGSWMDKNPLDYSWEERSKDQLLAWILIYDQLPRHAARHRPENASLIEPLLTKALALVEMVLEEFNNPTSGFRLEDFTPEEFGFLTLPLRHTYNANETHLAMSWLWKKIQQLWSIRASGVALANKLKPFMVAAYQRAPMLSLTAPMEDTMDSPWVYFPAVADCTITRTSWESFRSILAYLPESAVFEGEPKAAPLELAMPSGIQESPLLISLSGGVDSMVLLWSLLQKRAAATAPQAPHPQAIAAVYIHYCNRGDMEEAFIREVCRSWNVPLYIRRIREIQRLPAMKLEMREAYETYTRRCRYHAYHHAHAHMTADAPAKPPIYIGLGHNHDDCFENILTNICHRQKYDNLKGMSSLSETEGILFWRPMLSVPKKTIYDLAQKNGIPYLEDSTPSWSCRGKIRDTIRPPMESFHPTFIQSFFELSHSLGELMTLLVETAQRLYDKTTFTGNTAHLTVSAQDLPTACWSSVRFWKCYFEFLYGGKAIPSHKSLSHFCERLNALRRPPIPGAQQPTQPTQIRAYLKKHLKAQVVQINTAYHSAPLATLIPSVYQFSFGFDDC